MKKEVVFVLDCKKCNKRSEIQVSKNQVKKLIPRYCIECGNKDDYSKIPCSL